MIYMGFSHMIYEIKNDIIRYILSDRYILVWYKLGIESVEKRD